MFLELQNIQKKYNNELVLKDISFSVEKGQNLSIVGSSGSGKSTLLYSIGTLEKIDAGKVLFEGENIASLNDKKKAEFRNQKIGFVFQFHFLLPSLSCYKNIMLPSQLGSKRDKDLSDRIMHYAEILKVQDCLKKYPYQISGGEQQRINIIRALSLKPPLLLCDEPTGNLDSKNTETVMELLIGLGKKANSSLIVVTHDAKVSQYFSNKITIEDGRIIS